jgi:hypothetical protein
VCILSYTQTFMKSISPVEREIYIIKKIKQKILTYCSTGSWVSRKA